MKFMNKILLIGNSGFAHNISDGQTEKTRIYLKKIKDEGFDVDFVDLEDFKKHFLSILWRIRKGIKKCDRVILLAAQRGSKILIPYINKVNKKIHKPFILPLIGISILHNTIDKLNDCDKNSFLINGEYSFCKKDKKMAEHLSKISFILPETDLLSRVFRDFYNLNNVVTLNNFREIESYPMPIYKSKTSQLRIVFLSRVMRIKGIFELLETINEINHTRTLITLDIYGKTSFNKKDNCLFNSYIKKGIRFFGQIDNSNVVSLLSAYDLFVFPTNYMGEGTPGVITESLLAGTPILTSDFPQARFLLKDGFDSIFFNMFDKKALKEKLLWALHNQTKINNMRLNVLASSNKYTFGYNRDIFLKYVCGVQQ